MRAMNGDIQANGSQWQMADFMIHTIQGPFPQTGMVSPPFSIHIDSFGRHVLSHLWTGYQCCRCTRWTDAISIADELRSVGDWDFDEIGGPGMKAIEVAVKANAELVQRMKDAAAE